MSGGWRNQWRQWPQSSLSARRHCPPTGPGSVSLVTLPKAAKDTVSHGAPGREWMQDLIKIKLCFNASWSVCVSRSMVHGPTRELILYLWSLEQYLLRELIKSWVNSVHIGSETSCSFFPLLLYSACIYSSLVFSTRFYLLYLLHPSDSFPFSSLLFSCSLFKCTCPKFNCNSWYRVSFEGIKSWVNSVHIGSDTSCSFFPLLLYSACIYSSLFFSTLFFSFTFSILLILSLSLLYSFHVVSLSALARSLTVIVDIGSLLRELNLELLMFILALILPALSSLFFSTLLVFILPSSFQLFFSPLPSPSFWFFPFLFSTLFM